MVGAGEKGRLKVTEEKTRPLQYSMLPSDGSVILDTDFGVFIRVGAGAGQREVKNAFKSAGVSILYMEHFAISEIQRSYLDCACLTLYPVLVLSDEFVRILTAVYGLL